MTHQWGPVFSGSYLIWNLEHSPQASCFAVGLDSPLLRDTNFLLIRILDFRRTSLFQSRLDKWIFWVGLDIWVQKAPGHTACWLRGNEMEVYVWCSYHILSAKHIKPSTCISISVFSDILWVLHVYTCSYVSGSIWTCALHIIYDNMVVFYKYIYTEIKKWSLEWVSDFHMGACRSGEALNKEN